MKDLKSRGQIYSALWLFLLIVTSAITLPVFSLVMATFFLAYISANEKISVALVVITIVSIFAFLNAGKGFDGDWEWYTQHYIWLNNMSFSDYYGQRIGQFNIKVTEPLYYFVSFLISRLTNGNTTALAIVVTFLIYIPFSIAQYKVVRSFIFKNHNIAFIVGLLLLIGITFTLSTQLVRQEIASALLLCGLIFLIYKNYLASVPLLFCACFTHNSSFVFLIFVSIAFCFSRLQIKPVYLLCLIILGCTLGVIYLSGPGYVYYESGHSDGDISLPVMMMDMAIFIAMIMVYRFMLVHHYDNQAVYLTKFVLLLFIGYGGFMLGLSLAPLPFLRMYFYVELLRSIGLAILLSLYFTKRRNIFIYVLFAVLAMCYLYARMQRALYHYDFDILTLLFWSPFIIIK